jgi:glycosyltransferase involved in cell wall biosynthesis
MMRERGYRVTLLTSDFNHYAKTVRDVEKFRQEYPDFNDIEIVHMPSYEKNVSIARWRSGDVWARNVDNWLKAHYTSFDIVYAHMPDIPTILRIKNFCKEKNLKLVIDIRDLWPEVFRVLLKKEWLYKSVTYPIKKRADRCYAAADELIAVSEEYLQRGLSVNKKSKDPVAVYIGATFDRFYEGIEKYAPSIDKKGGEVWVTYAGTLGSTYDLYTLLDSAEEIRKKSKNRIVFKILGQGPESESLMKYAKTKQIDNVDFVGFVEYEKMAAYLSKSDMTINSVKRRASQSIINKVADYFAAGVPCLNGSLCKEMQQLISDYQVGINFEPENVNSLVDAILFIVNNPEKVKEFGENAKSLATKKFDRSITYLEILKRLDNMVH